MTDEEETSKLVKMAEAFRRNIDTGRYVIAYDLFKENPDVAGLAQISDINLIYFGFRSVSESAAKEFADYILKKMSAGSEEADYRVHELMIETLGDRER